MRHPASSFSDPNSFVSDPGSQFYFERSPVLLKDGTIKLEVSGKVDIKESINSQVPLCDMNVIASRLLSGQPVPGSSHPPIYGDFTNAPTSLSDALNRVIEGERMFAELPIDVRARFDYDFKKWFASAGSADWFEKMGSVNSPVPDHAPADPVPDPVPKSE